MKLLQNKTFAIITMILCIIIGTLIGSHNSLSKLSSKAEAIFFSGVNNDGISIESDLNRRSELARNLVTVASSYLPKDSEPLNAVSTARDYLNTATSISEKYDANKALDEAVYSLYSLLETQGITEKDELINNYSKNPSRIYTDFRSFGDTITHDKYNEYAKEFNYILESFPANILGKLTMIKPLELFK